MATRANPFYTYRNPGLGQGFNGMAEAMFSGGADPLKQSGAVENMAQARAADALAGYRGEQARGQRDMNNAMVSPASALAELFLGGGVLKDDPFRANPDFQPAPAVDYGNILTSQAPAPGPVTSAILSGLTAQDKMAMAIQEAAVRNLKLDDVMKAAGMAGFASRAASSDPNTALAFAPYVGLNPNTQTALSTVRQDAISARDADEEQAKQDSINTTNLQRERIQQGGANYRTQYTTDNKPVTAANNQDVIVTPAQGKALGITPNEAGQYIVRGRATVGSGGVQQPGTLGGEPVQGQPRAAGGAGGTGGAGAASKVERFKTAEIKAVNGMLETKATTLNTTLPMASRDLIRNNASQYYSDPQAPEYRNLSTATDRAFREFFGSSVEVNPTFGRRFVVPESVTASVRKALAANVAPDKVYGEIAKRTGYTRQQIEAAINAQQPAR